MRIALFEPCSKHKKGAVNKDLAGGFGTASYFGTTLTSKLLTLVKKKSVKLPILSFAHLQAILKQKGHEAEYINKIPLKEYDLILIYGSLVDLNNEAEACQTIKRIFPKTKAGFFGALPTVRPDLFQEADFVIRGEAESFFLHDFKDLGSIKKTITVKRVLDLNELPTPDFDGFPIHSYSYFPAIKEKPFVVLQASRGCPYSCSYYCAYGLIQGSKYRIASPEKLLKDIVTLKRKYNIKGLQFRDPTFGINKAQVREFCKLLIDHNTNIKFGIETRLDLLDRDLLKLMHRAGLRNINVGIETANEDVAKLNKRQLITVKHQEDIIDYCKKIGIKVSAFYILGLAGDTEESIKNTVKYAISLNTNTAQFAISCPFPETEYYKELKSKNLITENDLEKFNACEVVFKHDTLTKEQIMKLKEYAFRKYYFRFGYLLEFLKWRIRES